MHVLGHGPGSVLLSSLRTLGAVLRAALLAILYALGIKTTAHDVIADAWKVLDSPASDQHNRVLLEIVPFTADVADDLEPVREAHLGNFT